MPEVTPPSGNDVVAAWPFGDGHKQHHRVRGDDLFATGAAKLFRRGGLDVEAGAAETAIADGVQQHIRIRMPKQAFGMRNFYTAENQVAPGDQLVHVVAMANTHHRDSRSCSRRKSSASARSSGTG